MTPSSVAPEGHPAAADSQAPRPSRRPRLLVAGYYGFGNTGDEAILASLLQDLRRLRPEWEYVVVSGDPDETAGRYRVESVLWTDLPAILDAAERCDAILLGGGGLFQDYWGAPPDRVLTRHHAGIPFYSGLPLLAALTDKPCMLYAVGVGPLLSDEAKMLTCLAFELATAATVRDAESRSLLEAIGFPAGAVRVTADPGFRLPADREAGRHLLRQARVADGRPLLGVCLRNWRAEAASDTWQEEVAAALDRFLGEHGGSVVFVPFQVAPGDPLTDDLLAAEGVVTRMGQSCTATVLPGNHPPEALAGVLAHCDLVLGMRLHALVFAVTAAVPVVALSYDPKVASLAARVGVAAYTLGLPDVTSARLADTLGRAWRSRDAIRADLARHGEELRSLAGENAVLAAGLLDGPPARRPEPALSAFVRRLVLRQARELAAKERAIDDLGTRLAVRDQEIHDLQVRLREIERSRAWKLIQPLRAVHGAAARAPVLARRALLIARTEGLAVLGRRVRLSVGRSLAPLLRARHLSSRHRLDLERILAAHPGMPIIVARPFIDWGIPLFQRPHHLAQRLAAEGFLYFYCTPNVRDRVKGFQEIAPRCYVTNRFDLVDALSPQSCHVYSTDHHCTLPWVAAHLDRGDTVLYDYIDEIHEDISGRPVPQFVREKHEFLLKQEARVVCIASADKLYRDLRRVRSRNCALVTNGVDPAHFAVTRDPARTPPVIATLVDSGRPLIGYFGALAKWFDYPLLQRLSRERPGYQILLIGWNYDDSVRRYPWDQYPNITILGPVEYRVLPQYACWFDVAMIPFLVNDITRSTSPIKLFEYMALGKPIVTTHMPECRKYRSVLIGETPEKFIASVDRALTLRDDAAYLETLRREASMNTWEQKAAEIADLIRRAGPALGPPTLPAPSRLAPIDPSTVGARPR